ncbi:unnamed protein product [Somion occarium]|uniref:Uncharacterized protein n=1 Tax=Somion occarium TaxID=3059160 RepID=A0ABP1D099_9APHY
MHVLGAVFGGLFVLFRCVLAQSASSFDFKVDAAKETSDTTQSDNAESTTSVNRVNGTVEREAAPDSTTTAHSINILHPPNRTHSHTLTHIHTGSRTLPITHRLPPPPTQSGNPLAVPSSTPPDQPPSHHQSPVAIVFECLAGLVGLIFIVWFTRCLYQYKRTPRQDRIAALLSRHELEREMEELEREQLQRRRRRTSLLRPPPPPYQPAPAYESVVTTADV